MWTNVFFVLTQSFSVFFCSAHQLIPLFIFIGGGVTMSATYLARLALKNPDVSWVPDTIFFFYFLAVDQFFVVFNTNCKCLLNLSVFMIITCCTRNINNLKNTCISSNNLKKNSCHQMGSHKQPWALEQIGAQSAVQSKSILQLILNSLCTYFNTLKNILFCYHISLWPLVPASFCKGQPISFLLSCLKVHIAFDWLCTFVCVSLCSQLFAINMDYSKLKKDRPDF